MSFTALVILCLCTNLIVSSTSVDDDLIYLRKELELLKGRTDSLERLNNELRTDLKKKETEFTTVTSAMKNDMAFLHDTVELTRGNVTSIQQRMKINRGFTVKSTKGIETLQSGITLVFDFIVSSVGNGYNNKTGVYTTDMAGWYIFFFDVRTSSTDKICWTDLIKNGNVVVTTYAMSGIKHHQHSSESNMAYIRLEVGDRVWIHSKPAGGHGCGIDDLCSFSGYLLHAV